MHTTGQALTVVAFGAGAVSVAHIVKATEPLFSTVTAAVFLKTVFRWQVRAPGICFYCMFYRAVPPILFSRALNCFVLDRDVADCPSETPAWVLEPSLVAPRCFFDARDLSGIRRAFTHRVWRDSRVSRRAIVLVGAFPARRGQQHGVRPEVHLLKEGHDRPTR